MSTERFTTNCPSCDAGVAVKAALVGKKIECPKCKFRFVVPAPGGGGVADDTPKAKGGKPKGEPKAAKGDDAKADPKGGKEKSKGKKEKKEAKGGGNGKVIVGAIVGVIALVGLAFGAILIFSKLNSNQQATNTGSGGGNASGGNSNGSGGGGRPVPGGPGNPGDEQPGGPDGEGGPGGPGGPGNPGDGQPGGPTGPGDGQPGGTNPPTTPGGTNTPKPPPRKPTKSSGVEVTNLLPNDTVSVFHARVDDVDRNARTLRNVVFDKVTIDLFEKAMNFPVDQVTELVQGEVGKDRTPFVVFRTKSTLDETMFANPKMDTTTSTVVKGRAYREVNRNAFLSAAENSLGIANILAPMLGFELPAADASKTKSVKYAICLYDANTLIVAETNQLQRYLGDLTDSGYPEFLTQYKEPEVAPVAPPTGAGGPGGGEGEGEVEGGRGPRGPGGRGPGGPGGPGGPPPGVAGPGGPPPGMAGPGGPPPGMAGPGGPPPGMAGPGGPGGPGGPAVPAPKLKKSLSNYPTFLSVTKDLKKALNTLEDEGKDQPVAVYVTKISSDQMSLLDLPSLLAKPEMALAMTAMKDFKVLGLAIARLNEKRGSFTGYIEYASSDAAKNSVEQQLIPGLTLMVATKMSEKLKPVSVRNLDDPSTNPNPGGSGGYPGGSGGYPGGPGGYPGGPGGSPGLPPGVPNIPPPGAPGQGGTGGGKDPESNSPRSGGGAPDGENAQGPPPRGPGSGGQQPPSSSGGSSGYPGGPGGYPGGSGGYPGGPGGPGGPGYPGGENPGGTPAQPGGNTIDISRDGTVVTLAGEFNWKDEVFATVVEPVFARQGSVVRGKMGMYSGEAGVFGLAAKPVDGGKPTGGVVAMAFGKDAPLPQGALHRDARTDDRRLPGTTQGLPYQPEQRVSFFAELTKYMDNRTHIYRKLDQNQAWYQKGGNLELAETWIPELLVPDYPQSAWRATSDLIADGRSVGATNYVGVAGLGLDAARLNPKNADDAKKAGMTGYDFGSKPDDVKDGLSNTMYLIQVPPTYQRPWMAGGGATLQGVNDKGNDPARPFLVKKADGSRGTMVLMGDGSVRSIKEGVDPAVFRGMATRAGGETLADLDKAAPPARPNVGELKAVK
jgi:hypothetical protein